MSLTFVIAFLIAFSFSTLSYLLLDNLTGEGHIENKIKSRFEALLEHRAPSIATQTTFSNIVRLHQILKRQPFSKKLHQLLVLSGWSLPLSMFLLVDLIWATVVFAVVDFITHQFVLAMLVAGGLAVVPYIFLVINKQRYLNRFTAVLPEAILMMKGALRAGQGLQAAFQIVADEGPKPVSTEFGRVVQEIELGAPVSEALNELYQRIPTLDLRLFILGIHIQHEIGGNLLELFDHVEQTIRDRITLAREIRVLSAQGKLTGAILICLPLALIVIISVINPGFFDPLLKDPLGRRLIWIAMALQAVGGLVIHRLTYFKATE